MSAFKHGKTIETSVCVQKGCTLMMIRLENTAQLKFYSLILELFERPGTSSVITELLQFCSKYFSLFWHTI